MKWITKSSLVSVFLLIASQSYSQGFQVEATAVVQSMQGPSEKYNLDTEYYLSFTAGYKITSHQSVWLSFSSISSKASLPHAPGEPSGVILKTQQYPIGLEYRYYPLNHFIIQPFLKAAFLIVPIKDQQQTDTPPQITKTTQLGGDAGIGIAYKLFRYLGIMITINYRAITDNNRPNLNINPNHIYGQAGIQAYF